MTLALILASTAIYLWSLEERHPLVARWCTVLIIIASIVFWMFWKRKSSMLTLLLIPVALSAALINVKACVATTSVTSVLAGVLFWFVTRTSIPFTSTALGVFLLTSWGVVGAILGIYLPIEKLALWAWHYYREAQISVEHARDSKVELTQSIENLEYANRQLALINERATALRWVAEEAQQAKSAFVARVSHEFRTPLNIIIGMVNLMVENPEVYTHPPVGKVREQLAVVYRNCQHLASMINDVLALSQAQAGRITLHRSDVQLTTIIDSACAIVKPLIIEKQLEFNVLISGDLPLVYCDQIRIRQILLNLLSNAARLTQQGSISIQAVTEKQHVILSVKDTGPGISPEELERIFEPFFQGTLIPWQTEKGSGLGLSISKQFVALHGGRMWVESEVGLGSTFFIELPVEPIQELESSPTRWIQEDWEWRDRQERPSFPHAHYRPRIVVWHESPELALHSTWTTNSIEWVHSANQEIIKAEVLRGTCRALLVNVSSPEKIWPIVENARNLFPEVVILGCCYTSPENPLINAGAEGYLIKPLTQTQLSQAMTGLDRKIHRVLVVDDDADSRELLATFTQIHDANIIVTSVATGQEAFAVMERDDIDLVLLDLVLEEETGFDILHQMQADASLIEIPVIMVTAQDANTESARTPLLLATAGQGLALDKLTDGVNLLTELLSRADGV